MMVIGALVNRNKGATLTKLAGGGWVSEWKTGGQKCTNIVIMGNPVDIYIIISTDMFG